MWGFLLISNWDPSSPPDKQAAPATVKNLDVCNAQQLINKERLDEGDQENQSPVYFH